MPQKDIENGDTTPSTDDYTDFGNSPVDGGTVDRIFEIENFGAGALNLTGVPIVAISGAHFADFTVIDQPATQVASGNNDTFTIRFNPSAAGIRTATVSISSNDPNRNPYTFTIQGTGLPTVPVFGKAGMVLLITALALTGVVVLLRRRPQIRW